MKRVRDYKSEYQRRLKRAAARGLSRSQARGHPRAGEMPIRSKKTTAIDDRLENALKLLRSAQKQSVAAKNAGVSSERFRRFLKENGLAQRIGRTWVHTDTRPRRMTVLTQGRSNTLLLDGFDQASLNGEHLSAVRAFVNSNDIDHLRPFEGQFVRDTAGRVHPLETDPNRIYRLASQEETVFEEIYRLII